MSRRFWGNAGLSWPAALDPERPVTTGRKRPIAVVRAAVDNACYVAGTVLHFAKLDARKWLHNV